MKTVRVSATPSPSTSRSRLMRFALGTPAPARFITIFANQALMPPPLSRRGGALLSATSTSPLGSTYNQRGCCSPVANGVTAVPGAPMGWVPWGQPWAGATLTVGIKDGFGGGRLMPVPMPAVIGSLAVSPQAASAISNRLGKVVRIRRMVDGSMGKVTGKVTGKAG